MKLSRQTIKIGTYTLIVTTIVLAIVIAINLFAAALPADVKSIDTSKEKIYTVGDETKVILASIRDDVDIYMIVEHGRESATTETVDALIQKYADESSHIKYKVVDPGVSPNFVSQYTDENIPGGSVIVTSNGKSKVLSGDEWYMYETSEGRMSATEYNQLAQVYYMYYGTAPDADELFMGETAITSAIDYVTSGTAGKIYTLTGHGETALASTYTSILDESNIASEDINLISENCVIPEDCAVLMINFPSTDITAEEATAIADYYKAGGKVFLTTYIGYYSAETEPNLASLAEACGLKSVDGMVFEGDTAHYRVYQYNMLPDLSPSCPEEVWTDSVYTYGMTYAHGIIAAEGAEDSFKPILTTSDKAYLKSDINAIATLEKEEGDAEGKYNLAAASTLETDNGEAKIIWIASPAFFDASLDYGGNSALFKSLISWSMEGAVKESVPAKVISVEDLVVTESDVNTWRAVLVFVIPLSVLACGAALWFVRRKKR